MAEQVAQVSVANAAGSRLSTPFRLAVSPSQVWVEVRNNGGAIPALLAQIIILSLGKLLAWQPLEEMARTIGVEPSSGSTLGPVYTELVWVAVFVLIFNLLVAGLAMSCTFMLGQKLPFSVLLTWVAYSLVPLAFGYLAGTIPLWLVQPLSTNIMTVFAWQIKPFSFGIATYFPALFTPLSAQWFVASLFDAFGIWSLALFVSGAKYYLQQDFKRIVWITLGLVLIFFIAAIGAWQVFQAMLVRLG